MARRITKASGRRSTAGILSTNINLIKFVSDDDLTVAESFSCFFLGRAAADYDLTVAAVFGYGALYDKSERRCPAAGMYNQNI
jgi:hypothetical protein